MNGPEKRWKSFIYNQLSKMSEKKRHRRSVSFGGSKKTPVKKPSRIHPRNKHQGRYDLDALQEACPELTPFIQPNVHGNLSVDFANPKAVKTLNKALLIQQYGLTYWDIPEGYLCPPIPGRADYIHHLADVLGGSNFGRVPTGPGITCMDVGVGANCIYPIVGCVEYGWSFIGSDIDEGAIVAARQIVDQNDVLKGQIELRHQPEPKDVFYGVLRKEEKVDLTVCNPPFHASAQAAEEASLRKLSNLNRRPVDKVELNFGGKSTELWTQGGERRFIRDMIKESAKFAENCFWFSTLISKEPNLKGAYDTLNSVRAAEVKTIRMGQGNKSSRVVAWTFLNPEQQKAWKNKRWKAD